jgi:hypothetical protein
MVSEDALSVECPYCHAEPDNPCLSRVGRRALVVVHKRRGLAAVDEWSKRNVPRSNGLHKDQFIDGILLGIRVMRQMGLTQAQLDRMLADRLYEEWKDVPR